MNVYDNYLMKSLKPIYALLESYKISNTLNNAAQLHNTKYSTIDLSKCDFSQPYKEVFIDNNFRYLVIR
jgi:hypothetical protein